MELNGLQIPESIHYLTGMLDKPAKRPKPKLPKIGEEITIKVKVVRHGRNSWDTRDVITLQIPGYEYPVTVDPKYLKLAE